MQPEEINPSIALAESNLNLSLSDYKIDYSREYWDLWEAVSD